MRYTALERAISLPLVLPVYYGWDEAKPGCVELLMQPRIRSVSSLDEVPMAW
jgi:hypothetical protein